MARIRFIPRASAQPRIVTVQVTAYDVATTYTITIGDYVASAIAEGSADATATALAALIDAATHGHASDLAASASTDTVTITGKADGLPFEAVAAVDGGTGTIGAATQTQAAKSAYHLDAPENYEGGALPGAGDVLEFSNIAGAVLWGLDGISAELAAVEHFMTATGNLGRDPIAGYVSSADGASVDASLREYREHRLVIDCAQVVLGLPASGRTNGSGAALIAIECAQDGGVIRVVNTAATPARATAAVVDAKLTHATSALIVDAAPGGAGLCDVVAGEAGAGLVQIPARDSTTRVVVGDNVTVASWQQYGGNHVLRSAADVATVGAEGGTLLAEGEFAIDALTARNANVIANNTDAAEDAITAATLGAGAVLDGTATALARDWGTVTLAPGARVRINGAVTVTTLAYAEPGVELSVARLS